MKPGAPIRLVLECTAGHKQEILYDRSLGVEMAVQMAGLLDGSSPMFVRKGTPESDALLEEMTGVAPHCCHHCALGGNRNRIRGRVVFDATKHELCVPILADRIVPHVQVIELFGDGSAKLTCLKVNAEGKIYTEGDAPATKFLYGRGRVLLQPEGFESMEKCAADLGLEMMPLAELQ